MSSRKTVADIEAHLRSRGRGLSSADVTAVFDAVAHFVLEGHDVGIRGFGVFERKKRKARKARNIVKNTVVAVPPRVVVALRAAPEVTDKLNKGGKA